MQKIQSWINFYGVFMVAKAKGQKKAKKVTYHKNMIIF